MSITSVPSTGNADTVIASCLGQTPLFTALDMNQDRFSRIRIASIIELVERRDQRLIQEHGGIEGIVSALETHIERGIRGDESDIACRRQVFGSNMYGDNMPAAKTFYYFILEALKDPMILILLVSTVLSIGFGIRKHGLEVGWYECVAKLAAIFGAVLASAGSNFWPERQCQKLSVDSGKSQQVDVVDKLETNGQSTSIIVDGQENPFFFTGTNVVLGYAHMVVTAVGKNTESQTIKLDGKLVEELENLTSVMGKAGDAVASLIFLVLFFRLFAGKIHDEEGNQVSVGGKSHILDALVALVGIVATPAMIAVTSTPRGLLLAVKIALAYSMKKMIDNDVLLKKPSLCNAIGSVTTICANATGSLTMDSKEVTKFWLGLSSIERVSSGLINKDVQELLRQGIGINTSQHRSNSLSDSSLKTEKEIFDWAKETIDMNARALKESYVVVETDYFNPEKLQSGVLILKRDDGTFHLHRKGAPEVILPMCNKYYETTGQVKYINNNEKALLEQTIEGMARDGLRCIAFAHKKTSIREFFASREPQLILLGLAGLKSSLRPGVKDAVKEFQHAGVNFKMITGDNISTARAVATACGILNANSNQPGEIIEGREFRSYRPDERIDRIDNIRVMARATPSDKFLMVQCLKEKGHVVAVMGRSIGDMQAMREADLGVCLSMKSADIAKACSHIVIRNEEFPSAVHIFKWGRGIYDSVQIYTQFLLTANFVALVVDSVMAVTPSKTPGINTMAVVSAGKAPYLVFQLMWVKLIMDTMATLALVVREAPEELMHKPPRDKSEPLITDVMKKNIMAQTTYQIAILLTLHFKGESIFNVSTKVKQTMLYNTYVLCQVVNMFNATSPEKNFFEAIKRTKLFWGIAGTIVVFEAIMVEVLIKYADTTRLDMGEWCICIAMVAVSWLIGWLVKCIVILERSFSELSNGLF
ncbi:hypothetical protein RJ640_011475 [Escallonia rubra]|uniref:Calcium-transporting ATPase n=1 Tax=Escallonia rubra TaxID=112253 RepID=A0AA88R3T0_9ASTE|nr:hypothetical protein RJ640_011475 [Escallonia rubra]